MAYWIQAIPMTLGHLQGHLSSASFLKCDFLIDKILTEWTDSTSCGLSAVANSLVNIIVLIICWYYFFVVLLRFLF